MSFLDAKIDWMDTLTNTRYRSPDFNACARSVQRLSICGGDNPPNGVWLETLAAVDGIRQAIGSYVRDSADIASNATVPALSIDAHTVLDFQRRVFRKVSCYYTSLSLLHTSHLPGDARSSSSRLGRPRRRNARPAEYTRALAPRQPPPNLGAIGRRRTCAARPLHLDQHRRLR